MSNSHLKNVTLLLIIIIIVTLLFCACDNSGKDTPTGPFTIKFVSNCDTNIPQKTLQSKQVLEFPSLDKLGYKLEGWYFDSAFSQKVPTTYYADRNCTLYAKWERYISPAEKAISRYLYTNGSKIDNYDTVLYEQKTSSYMKVTSIGYENVPGIYKNDINGLLIYNFYTEYSKWMRISVIIHIPFGSPLPAFGLVTLEKTGSNPAKDTFSFGNIDGKLKFSGDNMTTALANSCEQYVYSVLEECDKKLLRATGYGILDN